MTPEHLHAILLDYLNSGKQIECHDLEFVADWKKWMSGCNDELHDHTGKGSAHHFRFQRDAKDEPVMLRMKHLVSDEQWFPRKGIQLVKNSGWRSGCREVFSPGEVATDLVPETTGEDSGSVEET